MCVVKICNEDVRNSYHYPSDVRNLIQYIFRDSKVYSGDKKDGCVFAKAIPDFFGSDAKMLRDRLPEIILRNHEVFGKTEGKLVHHLMLSFRDMELRLLLANNGHMLQAFMDRLLRDYFNMGYLSGYAVHWDTEHPHIHLFVDNISFLNGNRFFLKDEALIIQGMFDGCFYYYFMHKQNPVAIPAVTYVHMLPPVHFAQTLF